MAATQRERELALIRHLAAEAPSFSFVQAVQILERLAPNAAPVGELGPPNKESIRFVHDPSMAFQTSDVTTLEPAVTRAGTSFAQLTSTFFGLTGTVSPLAMHFTEDVLRAEEEESPLRAFYDIFHHRLTSLFYRTWKKYSFTAGFRTDGTDPFTRRALAFVGVDTKTNEVPSGLSPQRLLGLAHLLALPTRPARSLRRILEGLLPDTNIEVESFISRRVVLADDQLSKVGTQNMVLGTSMTIGRSVVDRSARFRVGIGPLKPNMFHALLPGGAGHARSGSRAAPRGSVVDPLRARWSIGRIARGHDGLALEESSSCESALRAERLCDERARRHGRRASNPYGFLSDAPVSRSRASA